MECSTYAPLLSRYADDDLETGEAEGVLQHLSICPNCQKEVEALEQLRGWLHAAHSFEELPEIRPEEFICSVLGEWDLADGGQAATGQPSAPSESNRLKRPAGDSRWSMRRPLDALMDIFPSPRVWRFALLLLLAAAAAFLWMDRDQRKTVDVRSLPASASLITALFQKETDETGFYVLEHSSQQPWVRYEDELPVIQLVSDSAP